MKRWPIAALGVLVVAGCAGMPSQAAFEKVVSSWQGHDINEVIRAWGSPAGTFRAPDGNVVYTFEEGRLIASTCTVNFTVDPAQKIVAWRYSGTACRVSR